MFSLEVISNKIGYIVTRDNNNNKEEIFMFTTLDSKICFLILNFFIFYFSINFLYCMFAVCLTGDVFVSFALLNLGLGIKLKFLLQKELKYNNISSFTRIFFPKGLILLHNLVFMSTSHLVSFISFSKKRKNKSKSILQFFFIWIDFITFCGITIF